MDWYAWSALASMTVVQIALGMDNIVVASAIAGRLAPERQWAARKLGLLAATTTRMALLLLILRIEAHHSTLFTVLSRGVSGRDLLFLAGGSYLLFTAMREIHERMEGLPEQSTRLWAGTLTIAVVQISLIDLTVSLDNVVTLIGMTEGSNVGLMLTALALAGSVLIVAEGPVTAVVSEHESVRVLTLGIILLIGMSMAAEGLGQRIPKGYIHFATGFAVFIEMVNIKTRQAQGQRGDDHS